MLCIFLILFFKFGFLFIYIYIIYNIMGCIVWHTHIFLCRDFESVGFRIANGFFASGATLKYVKYIIYYFFFCDANTCFCNPKVIMKHVMGIVDMLFLLYSLEITVARLKTKLIIINIYGYEYTIIFD